MTQELEGKITSYFLSQVETKVLKDHNAYFLNQLCEDCKEISKEFGLDDSPTFLRYSHRMKETLIRTFSDKIQFSKVGKYVAVHPYDVSPLTYTVSTLKGYGLREESIVRCFANLVRRKLLDFDKDSENEVKGGKYIPPSAEEFLNELDKFSPLKCIFNAISLSINPKRIQASGGYVKAASSAQAEKINAISECWERLLTNRRTPTTTALSLTLHRITGSKEAIQLCHHAVLGISYADVRAFTNHWAKEVSNKHTSLLPSGFAKGKNVHVTFDNSDGKQQTLLGDRTTHHTNGTIFQLVPETERNDCAIMRDEANLHDDNKVDFGIYRIPVKRNRADPPSFPEFTDKYKESDCLNVCRQRDFAWVLAGFLGERLYRENNPTSKCALAPVGSWTAFMKDTSDTKTFKCKLEYLPVVPFPPTDNIIKWYIDRFVDIAKDLEIDHIFVHADEAIYSKVAVLN